MASNVSASAMMRTGIGRSTTRSPAGLPAPWHRTKWDENNTRNIAALMVPAHRLVNLRPRKLNAADNLMANHRVVRHLAKLLGIERSRLAEQSPVDRHLTDVVQISGAEQSSHFAGIRSHRFPDRGGIAAYAQRVAV